MCAELQNITTELYTIYKASSVAMPPPATWERCAGSDLDKLSYPYLHIL